LLKYLEIKEGGQHLTFAGVSLPVNLSGTQQQGGAPYAVEGFSENLSCLHLRSLKLVDAVLQAKRIDPSELMGAGSALVNGIQVSF
jgi:hypothetical protein